MTLPPDDNGAQNVPLRPDADKGREPQLLPGHGGRKQFSLKALLERIEEAFVEEYGRDSDILREADTSTKRLKLVLETVNYIVAVESVQLGLDEKADLINRAYSNLFGYGPLDPLFLDERVTTISLEGASGVAVRYGSGDLLSLGPLFEDNAHLENVIGRLLMDAHAELRDDQPSMEVGLMVGERPVSISLVAPPITYRLSADIRVHPKTPPTLDSLIDGGFMIPLAAELLRALVASPYGFVIAGDSESGKTTLMSVLAGLLPPSEQVISVERAGELRLSPQVERLTVRWPVGHQPGVSFGEQIAIAADHLPACILLDEIRADESETIAPLLTLPLDTRQMWAFRAAADAKRLRSALGMLARRANMSNSEPMVLAMYERLPFTITLARFQGQLHLFSVGEWQRRDDTEYPDYVELLHLEEGMARPTGRRPARDLGMSEKFWE